MKTKISYLRTFSTDWNTKNVDSGHFRIFCSRFVEYFSFQKTDWLFFYFMSL